MLAFFKKSVSKKRTQLYYNYGKAILFFIAAFLLLCSLCSYKANDPSFLFAQNLPTPIHNWCGQWGAHIAAFCIYLLGSASFILAIMLFFISYNFLLQKQLMEERIRLIAYALLSVVSAMLLHAFHFDFYQNTICGGYFGMTCYRFLITHTEHLIALLFLYALVIGLLIIIMRETFVKMIFFMGSTLWQLFRYWCLLMYRLGEHGYRFIFYGIKKSFGRSSYAVTKPIIIQRVPVKKMNQEKKEDLYESGEPLGQQADGYKLPPLELFQDSETTDSEHEYTQELERNAHTLHEKLERFGIYGKITEIKRGPVVTLFEYQPDIDTKISKIIALEDDLALALQATSIRIIAPIPGKSLVGFEIANKSRKPVYLSSLVRSESFATSTAALPMILGVDTTGNTAIIDLAKMPHLLIAGSTGSGKSVCLNAMLMSLLCKKTPDDFRLVIIDPKRLEFAPYADIAHLLFPVVTDTKMAPSILRWLVKQMEERYQLMAQSGARSIADYNLLQKERLPYIVIIIDELADLMISAGKEIEESIIRITQMARAAGIHLIAATQRPSVDVITGLIKVNFPSRISFRVTSKIDSRTILDATGADKLLGRGDMLMLDCHDSILKRLHGSYVTDQEIYSLIEYIRSQAPAAYHDLHQVYQEDQKATMDQEDPLYPEICNFLQELEEISISLLQRRFHIGYNRSARIIEMLEIRGKIMPSYGGKMRKIIR